MMRFSMRFSALGAAGLHRRALQLAGPSESAAERPGAVTD